MTSDASESLPQTLFSNPSPAEPNEPDALMYNLLLGEIAGQRGFFTVATEHYIAAARQSGDPQFARRATQIALYSRNLDLAITAAEIWLELEADSQEPLQLLAAFHMQKGDRVTARAYLVRLLNLGEYQTSVDYLKLARFFVEEDNWEPMLDVLEEVLVERPKDPEALRAFVLLALRLEQPAAALEKSNQLLEVAPDTLDYALLRERVLTENGESQQAVQHLESFLQRKPDEAKARMRLARLYIDLKQYDLARDHFLPLYRATPDDPAVLLALSLVSLQLEQLPEAEKYLLALTAFAEQRERAYYYLGQVAERQDRPDQALSWFSRINGADFRTDATIESAQILAKQGDLNAALALLHNHSGSKQDQVRLYLSEVYLLIEAERYEQAAGVADRGLALYGDNVELLLARSTVREKMSRWDDMEADLRKVLELDDNNAHAMNALGYVLADRGIRLEEAHGLITKALQLAPDNPYIIDSMGWIEYRLGNYEEAVRHLTRALEIMPDPEVYSHLGEVLWAMGRRAEAIEVIKQGLRNTPNDKRLLGARDKFGF